MTHMMDPVAMVTAASWCHRWICEWRPSVWSNLQLSWRRKDM